MFNLDHAIADWRRQLAAGGIKSPAVLDELESHLREDIDRQLRSGPAARPAFETAVQRIGETARLKAEFEKAGAAARTWKWNWLAVACLAFPILLLSRRTFILVKLFSLRDDGWSLPETAFGFAAIGLLALTLCSWPRLYRILPVIHDRTRRAALMLVCSLAGPVGYKLLPGFILPPDPAASRMIVTLLWMMIPCAALIGVIVGLDRAAEGRPAPAGS